MFFLARNFRDFCIMETIGLIFIAIKVIDGFRINLRFNVIVMTLMNSASLFFIFLVFLLAFNIALVPLAQSIWGSYLIGYKGTLDCLNSVMMIAYSKGNLESLIEINFYWSFLFMIIYYAFALFFLHAAFH